MTDNSKTVSPVVSRYEAAEFLGMSVDTLDRLRADGAIPASQVSRRLVKYRRVDLEAYLIACRTPAAAPEAAKQIDHAAAIKRAREIVRQSQLRQAAERGREAVRKLRRATSASGS